jgi:four helix bundle protein
MKRKTSNTERRTANAEWAIIRWSGDGRVKEDAPVYGTTRRTESTPNAQRTTNPRFNLEDRLLEFSARIIRLVDALPNTRAANHLAGQILRSGTSPYGNHGEVEAAESRKDFVHKLKVCLKELKETRRWLRLVKKIQNASGEKHAPHPRRKRRAGPNFLRQRPDSREKFKMTSRFFSLRIGRWALGVGRFPLLPSMSHAFAAQVFAGFGPGAHFPTTTS